MYRRLLHPLLARRGPEKRRRALARTEVFFPYFTMRVAFDDKRARGRLERKDIRVSPVEHYLHRLIAFAREADWGRRAVPPGRRLRSRERPHAQRPLPTAHR
jgi:hypothetical protein